MEIGSRGSLKSDINVTPLVDVMLVVLIIFMVVTPLMQKGVNVLLPEARNVLAVPDAESQVVTISLKANGEMYVGGDQVTELNLNNELQRRLAANPALQLQIKADRNVSFAEVKKLVRAGRDVGFQSASLIASEIKDEAESDGAEAR
jgi:biopolymer transport protein ExbD